MDSESTRLSAGQGPKSRRKFFYQLTALVGSITFWRTTTPVSGSIVSKSKLPTSRYYPQPSYLPKDYGSPSVYADLPDGFEGGLSEIALFYRNRRYPRALSFPLSIHLTPSPRTEFMGIENREGEYTELLGASAMLISAKYYTGMWMLLPGSTNAKWDESNAHSIVFQWQDLTVGIRGFRKAGISRDELMLVASSLK